MNIRKLLIINAINHSALPSINKLDLLITGDPIYGLIGSSPSYS